MANKEFKITPSHIKFIEKYAETGNGTLSYRYAYPKAAYSTARAESSRLLDKPEIIAELESKREELAIKFAITKQAIVNELIQNAELMLQAGDHQGYLKAKDMIIKMFGFYAPQGVDVTSAGEKITINLGLGDDD